MKLNILAIVVSAALLGACGSSPKNLGDVAASEAKHYDKVTENYRKGHKLIAKGNKEVAAGEKAVKKGNKKIKAGNKKIREGNDLLFKARKLYDDLRSSI